MCLDGKILHLVGGGAKWIPLINIQYIERNNISPFIESIRVVIRSKHDSLKTEN